jgi:hypothetical protein
MHAEEVREPWTVDDVDQESFSVASGPHFTFRFPAMQATTQGDLFSELLNIGAVDTV